MQHGGAGQIADISAVAAEKSPILEAFFRNYRGLLYTARATSQIIGPAAGRRNKRQGNETS